MTENGGDPKVTRKRTKLPEEEIDKRIEALVSLMNN